MKMNGFVIAGNVISTKLRNKCKKMQMYVVRNILSNKANCTSAGFSLCWTYGALQNSSFSRSTIATKSNIFRIHHHVLGHLQTQRWWPPVNRTFAKGLLPDTRNCGLRLRRECWERFPRHWLQRKPLVSDPGMPTARGSRTCRDACRDHVGAVAGKTFPAFPANAQPTILRIWYEAYVCIIFHACTHN